ncbi:MAG: neutral/alkaline non-lysosomal ceramidase N-terminal domain-containing protein [Verrucomicrobia bacterium]|nr:neutral/alkaline non-lysosomal ceramidase N-terminal domain-containing protein [Verrucomicrobiota bacterium]
MLPRCLLPTLLALLFPWVSHAAAPSFSAGAASVDITPDPAATNWVTSRPFEGVIDKLHARVLVLASGDARVAILTLDVTNTNESNVAEIREAISAAVGILPSHILVNSSHTHSGPLSAGYRWVGNPAKKIVTDSLLENWARQLPGLCAQAARQADSARRPVTLSIGRADVGEWLFNRRPVRPDGTVKSTLLPADPHSLPEGLRFGPVDPTATVLTFRGADGKPVATLLHLACHAVSVYSQHKGLSADWPGAACERLRQSVGGEVLFIQGCAGDIVPARRGLENARAMGAFIAGRAATAATQGLLLEPAALAASHATVGLPYIPEAAAHTGRPNVETEIQVISAGELALVALPGEPLIGLSKAIQDGSPFPHTLVLGYSNGDGAQYVGLPGEKIRGGYEMSIVGRGTDECGGFMIATALRLLREHRARPPRNLKVAKENP